MANLHIASREYMAYESVEDKLKSLKADLINARIYDDLPASLASEYREKEVQLSKDTLNVWEKSFTELNNLVELRISEVKQLMHR